MPEPITSRQDAEAADRSDPLAFARDRFAVPEGVVYLDGNSLGALPAPVPAALEDAVLRQWGNDLITSWNANGWWDLPARLGDRIATFIGAAPGQVICGDSTSVQLFQALVALARLRPQRHTIVIDGDNFPTDQYIAESVADLLGMRLVRTSPRDLHALEDDTAVVAFSAVDYRTGEAWDAARLIGLAHEAGAVMLWDLSHAVGAMPWHIDELGADAAVGCSYKYLNGGPGAPAWLYLARRHHETARFPLTGWHGHAEPFALLPQYTPAAGIARARIGTPPVLGMIALHAALKTWEGIDLDLVRRKSLQLTDLVIDYAQAKLGDYGVTVLTPREHERRGSQVALRMPQAYEVTQALIARNVIGDFRAPDILRLGLAAPYLRFVQVWDAMTTLQEVLDTGDLAGPGYARATSTVVT